MTLTKKLIVLAALCLIVFVRTATAWWDTQVQVAKPPPTVKTVQAETCPRVDAKFIVADPTACGGKSVLMNAHGPTLAFEADCRISHYAVFVISRAARKDFQRPSPPVILHLRVTNLKNGRARAWRQRICFTADWQDGAHLYFPVYEAGKYRIEVFPDRRGVDGILVDFLELKDVFGSLPCVGEKRAQNLHTPAEIAAIRNNPENLKLAVKLLLAQQKSGLIFKVPAEAAQWRARVFEQTWAVKPPRNLHFAGAAVPRPSPNGKPETYVDRLYKQAGGIARWDLQPGPGPFVFVNPKTKATYTLENWRKGEIAGNCAFPDDGTGFYVSAGQAGQKKPLEINWLAGSLMARYRGLATTAMKCADEYLRTGNEIAGWQAVCALVTYCELYPDVDFQTQNWNFGGGQFGMNPYGKFVYSGHAHWIVGMARAYDHLFPLIRGNRQLAALMGKDVPWIRRPEDVIKFLDTNLLQHIRDCVDRQVIRAGDGDSEKIVAVAAVVQGPGKAADWMWKLLFTRCHFRMTNRGGIQDHLFSSYNRDGCNYIGSMEYTKAASKVACDIAEMCRRFKQIGGKLAFDLSDLDKYPKVAQAPYYLLNRKVAGCYVPRVGDWGMASDPPQPREADEFRSDYLFGFRTTKDPRLAWMVRYFGREGESDAEWAEIQAAAEDCGRNPSLTNTTRSMPGFGVYVLEAAPDETDYTKKAAALLRAGVGQGHGHCDPLELLYWSKGCRLLTDNGRRGGTPNSRGSRTHNVVEVDDKDFLCTAYGRSGIGWGEACTDMQGVGYTRASARALSHPYLKVYRRDVVLVPVGDDSSYVMDVFRVSGGKVHTWGCEGPVNSEPTLVSFSTELKKQDTPLSKMYEANRFTHVVEGVCPDTLRITWQVDPKTLPRYLGRRKSYPKVSVRAWRLGVKGRPVVRGWAFITGYTGNGTPHNFVYTRNEGPDGLQGAYTTVTEGYTDDQPVVAKSELIAIPGAPAGAMAPRAVRVTCTDGQDDIVYCDGDGSAVSRLRDGLTVQAQFAYVSMAGGQVRQLSMLGGRTLSVDGLIVKTDAARYTGKVAQIDVLNNVVTLDRPFPAKVLDGASFAVTRPASHNACYIARQVDGARVRLRGATIVFQSAITHFDEAAGRVSTDMQPVLAEVDPKYYDEMPVVNEAGRILGRARIHQGDRWMYLGWPRHMQWNQRIRMDEIVDADKNGKRTLRMFSVGKSRKWLAEGQTEVLPDGAHLCDLEVTRVSDDGLTLWFKDPPEVFCDSLRVPHKAWPYHGMRLVTEDGKHTLTAVYPGTDYTLGVEGRKLTEKDFPDVDGDGRHTLMISDIGPGDTFDTPSRVSLKRVSDGVWQVEADCGVTLTLPGVDKVMLASQSGDRMRIQAAAAGAVQIPVSRFAAGPVMLLTRPGPDGAFSVPVH